MRSTFVLSVLLLSVFMIRCEGTPHELKDQLVKKEKLDIMRQATMCTGVCDGGVCVLNDRSLSSSSDGSSSECSSSDYSSSSDCSSSDYSSSSDCSSSDHSSSGDCGPDCVCKKHPDSTDDR
ncbi:uncharacterized protein LOC143036615 [Oratosquilla oratoria]|uniref:uncharacterized protein LOC143036615 n=1 Tax=Oratosquilla oratoria TaxID=337810 RepID=UPI003F75FD15